MTRETSLVLELVGEELSSVTFVGDYVQLDFNGPRLSLFVWPDVVAFGETRTLGDAGYRDVLCGLISRTVTRATDSPDDGLVLRFDADGIAVNPRSGFELAGPEIAMLQMNDEDRRWDTWRPGEDSFESGDW